MKVNFFVVCCVLSVAGVFSGCSKEEPKEKLTITHPDGEWSKGNKRSIPQKSSFDAPEKDNKK